MYDERFDVQIPILLVVWGSLYGIVDGQRIQSLGEIRPSSVSVTTRTERRKRRTRWRCEWGNHFKGGWEKGREGRGKEMAGNSDRLAPGTRGVVEVAVIVVVSLSLTFLSGNISVCCLVCAMSITISFQDRKSEYGGEGGWEVCRDGEG